MNKACSGIWLLSVAGAISPVTAFAVTANNVFVTVSSSTAGVEGIFPVGGDFYVTTRGVTYSPGSDPLMPKRFIHNKKSNEENSYNNRYFCCFQFQSNSRDASF